MSTKVVPVYGPSVWADYAEAVGLEALRATFGDHWPPQSQRPLEQVFAWVDGDTAETLAWLSLARDQFDSSVVHMSRGVWPDRHGSGLGREMRAWAEGWAREAGFRHIQIFVAVANWRHLARVMEDDYWDVAGALFSPAGFYFAHEIKPLEPSS